MIWPDPTQPPTKPHTHPWMGNSSQISNLQTELKYLDKLKCYRILSDSGGPPPGGGGWVDGSGGGYGCVRGSPMHACMHMHVKHAKHGCLHVGGHLQFLYMNKCVCACVCMHMHVCVGGTSPHVPRCPQPTCPLPRAAGSPKHQNSISPELTEIIRFCLKILYLWTFLNSYRL